MQPPGDAAFAAVSGKWKLIIIYWLSTEELHFAGLRHRMSSISHKVLTEQLRELEADGIVNRAPLGSVPAPVMYRLTDYAGRCSRSSRASARGDGATSTGRCRPAERDGARTAIGYLAITLACAGCSPAAVWGRGPSNPAGREDRRHGVTPW